MASQWMSVHRSTQVMHPSVTLGVPEGTPPAQQDTHQHATGSQSAPNLTTPAPPPQTGSSATVSNVSPISTLTPNLSGYLLKLGSNEWKRRWFLFDSEHGKLMYYPQQPIDGLTNVASSGSSGTVSGNRCLGVIHINHALIQEGSSPLEFIVLFLSAGRAHTMQAQDEEEKMYWINGLNEWKDKHGSMAGIQGGASYDPQGGSVKPSQSASTLFPVKIVSVRQDPTPKEQQPGAITKKVARSFTESSTRRPHDPHAPGPHITVLNVPPKKPIPATPSPANPPSTTLSPPGSPPRSTTTTTTTTTTTATTIPTTTASMETAPRLPTSTSRVFPASAHQPSQKQPTREKGHYTELGGILAEMLVYEPYTQQRSALSSADMTRQLLPDHPTPAQIQFLLRQIDFHIEHVQNCYQEIQNLNSSRVSSIRYFSRDVASGLLRLPQHIVLYVFSFLGPTDLGRTAQVSTEFRVLSDNNQLWAALSRSPTAVFDNLKDWKALYVSKLGRRRSRRRVSQHAPLPPAVVAPVPTPDADPGLVPTNPSPNVVSEQDRLIQFDPVKQSVKEGWLYKRGDDMLKLWKKRWFVISGSALFYFKLPKDAYPCGIIPLSSLIVCKERVPGRRNCFRLDSTSSGGLGSCKQVAGVGMTANKRTHCLLSAETEQDCDDWLREIRRTSVKYHTYHKEPSSATRELDEEIALLGLDSSFPTIAGPRIKLWGASLDEIMAQQKQHGDSSPIPSFLMNAFATLTLRALDEEGLFRISGSASELVILRETIESGKFIDLTKCDPHAVAGLVKSFFRELKDPLIPTELNNYALTVATSTTPAEPTHQQTEGVPENMHKIKEFKFIIDQLPAPNRHLLEALVALLVSVAAHSGKNKMNENNLLRVITPTVHCAPQLISYSMRYFDYIFKEGSVPGATTPPTGTSPTYTSAPLSSSPPNFDAPKSSLSSLNLQFNPSAPTAASSSSTSR